MNVLDELRRYVAPMKWRRCRVVVSRYSDFPPCRYHAGAIRCGRVVWTCNGWGPTKREAIANALQGARIRSAAGNGDTILRAIDRGAIRREMRAAWYGPPRNPSDDPGETADA